MRILASIIAALAAVIGLAACEGFKNGSLGGSLTFTTGGTGPVTTGEGATSEREYLVLGAKDHFGSLRQEIGAQSDRSLVNSIKSAKITRVMHDEGQSRKPGELIVSIEFSNPDFGVSDLGFTVMLKTGNPYPYGDRVYYRPAAGSRSVHHFSLDTKCLNELCGQIDLRLNKHSATDAGSTGPITGIAGFIFTIHESSRIQKVRGGNFNDSDLNKLGDQSDVLIVERTSYSIVDGRSATHVRVSESQQGPALLEFETEGADTAESEINISNGRLGGNNSPSMTLNGINPETSAIVISVTSPNTKETGTFVITDRAPTPPPAPSPAPAPVPAPDAPVPPSAPDPDDQPVVFRDGKRSFPVTLDEERLPGIFATYKNFESYSRHGEVQRMVRVWLGQESNAGVCSGREQNFSSDRLHGFVRGIQNVAVRLCQMGELMDVNCEIGALLGLESNYAVLDSYPATEVGSSNDVGPFQLTPVAVEDVKQNTQLPFQYFRLVNGQPDSRDHRIYFMNAAYMVMLRFKTDFAHFADDPAKAILAYKTGVSGAKGVLEWILNESDPLKMSLGDVVDFRMSNKNPNVCASINYAFSFLALRTIVQNLDQYSIRINGRETRLELIDPYPSDSYRTNFVLPGAPLPDGLAL